MSSAPRPRRIAFILPSFAGGGAERVLLTCAAALDPAAYAPEVIVLDGAGPWRNLVPKRIEVTDLGRKRIRSALLPLARALRQSGAEVAVSTIGALNLALLAIKPMLPAGMRLVVREANTPHRHASSDAGRRFYRWAYVRLYRRAAMVIVPASYIACELAEEFGVPHEKIAVLYNPVDSRALEAAARDPVRVPGEGRRFVAVGRLTHQKGFDRLLEMMAVGPPDAQLTILGDGPDRVALEGQRAELGLEDRVAMPGFATDAPRYIAGADALLLPSRWEGLPNVALEALTLGTPVIATPEAGGIVEIAAFAPPAAVILAKAGRDFVKAMAQTRAARVRDQRSSLLPENFHLQVVAARFQALLDSV